ncbi:kelch-like protein 29 isoform X2 [Bufo bufo]|uniref:kelch-like protein 29 isoform X2 n=1 Tax=Bufo bufo TaxID=8384 RepID=UPI001ABEE023|nr:kelch-like protein 29 isoform X2 [Bufo bufo]
MVNKCLCMASVGGIHLIYSIFVYVRRMGKTRCEPTLIRSKILLESERQEQKLEKQAIFGTAEYSIVKLRHRLQASSAFTSHCVLEASFPSAKLGPVEREPFSTSGHVAVVLSRNLVIVTGGYFRGDFVWYSIDWVLIYDSSDNCWRDGPPMKISRNCHCAVGIGLHLYVIGGSTDEGVVADVESLNLAEMTWESRKPLIRPVERAAAVSVDCKLYVICGRDENGDVYSGIQMLNTKTDVWNVITYSPMPSTMAFPPHAVAKVVHSSLPLHYPQV